MTSKDQRYLINLALSIAGNLHEHARSSTDVDVKLYCYEERAKLIIAAREIDFMHTNFPCPN